MNENKRYLYWASKFVIILLIFLLNSEFLNAQNRTWLNYEGGLGINSQSWNTGLQDFHPEESKHSIVGAYIEQELNNTFSIEIGINDKFYGFDSYYLGADTFNLMSYAQFFQIPLRVRSRINLFKERLYISPHIGVDYMHNNYDGLEVFPPDKDLEFQIKTMYPKDAIMYEGGLSLELILQSWKFAFQITMNYSNQEFVNYKIESINTYFSSSGSYTTYQIRIGYAISNIWQKWLKK